MLEDEKKDVGTGGSEGTGGAEDKSKETPKTFSQDEVNSLMKKEKESGRLAILKELGVEDVKGYKQGLDEFKKHQESQKTETQKATERAATEAKAKSEAEARANHLETKLSILTAGANKDDLEDITVLVQAKVSDTKTVEQAIKEVKEKHPSLFTATDDKKNNGTGSKPNNNKASAAAAGLGKRLAEAGKPATTNKSTYFSK